MATGINESGATSLKLNIIESVEALNNLSNRLDSCYQGLSTCIEGYGRSEILSRLEKIKDQMPVVISNVDSYITDINNAIRGYRSIDEATKSQLNNSIEKLSN